MLLGKKTEQNGFDNMGKNILLTIIVPTYKRPDKLIRCLESIFRSTYKKIEVIVINDSPEDDLSFLNKKFKIHLIQHKKETYWVRSRNEGAKLANGPLLFFIDDDNIIKIDTIEKLVKKYKKKTAKGAIHWDF